MAVKEMAASSKMAKSVYHRKCLANQPVISGISMQSGWLSMLILATVVTSGVAWRT